jgi:hypothetical protein
MPARTKKDIRGRKKRRLCLITQKIPKPFKPANEKRSHDENTYSIVEDTV